MSDELGNLRKRFEHELLAYTEKLPDNALHAPIKYILSLGGKRIRPSLVMLACRAFGGSIEEAIPGALAVEIFHNFSLVHDDIMDEAPLRRGKETVHQKWNVNSAILSGDAMLIEAYRQLCEYDGRLLPDLLELFNRTSAEVCLGQQYDMDFERDREVSEERYIEMIGLKTAVLLGCSLEMGALIAGAEKKSAQAIYTFGKAAGIGFQLQDDYLDAFGNPESFGKQVGGDIIANKKTYLIIRALQKAKPEIRKELEEIYFADKRKNGTEKVKRTLEIFRELHVDQDTLEKSRDYFKQAEDSLRQLNLGERSAAPLYDFLAMLQSRNS